ncbi:prim-pol domain-containing protein [Ramicandelaber brevisporus]|nr:prim-pol domain-containing protein [Ramicandelaber brevisporus]
MSDTLQLQLRQYYSQLFPVNSYYEWLNGGLPATATAAAGSSAVIASSSQSASDNTSSHSAPTRQFTHREFSFELAGGIYMRFQSFASPSDFRQELLRNIPHKIDIGAIYNYRPRDRKSLRPNVFQPVEKELVFDIDMTDYDEIRTCCKGGDICIKCWTFVQIAIKVIHAALTEDFGFEQLLWVFSGRRGAHCWVSDPRAKKLNNEGRKAIASYLEVVKGGALASRKVNLFVEAGGKLHPHLERSRLICEKYFVNTILEDMDILRKEGSIERALDVFQNPKLRSSLLTKWQNEPNTTSTKRWSQVEEFVTQQQQQQQQQPGSSVHLSQVRDFKIQYTYPRLDDKVTTQINHLLKSPFCIHPKSGKVCVPIIIEELDTFNPMEVPTLSQLEQELMELAEKGSASRGDKADYEHTSLKPYIDNFNKWLIKTRKAQVLKKASAATATNGKRSVANDAMASNDLDF